MLPIPATCWLCRLPLQLPQHGLCSLCLRQLPTLPTLCPRCALPAASAHQACLRCQRTPPPWQALVCVGNYQPPLSHWVRDLKFSGVTALRVMLARLLLLSFQHMRRQLLLPKPDLVLCVPLHHRRAWQRGYNQTALLAAPLAHWLHAEFSQGLVRTGARSPQHQLNAQQRKANLQGAFHLEIAVQGRHIALIDDVVTTGSTVAEISRTLLAQGAASIQTGCLCRTL
ncbi:phosphoribosyltransferase family protein [Pantoea sp. A4]|uniref:phosphoribosyltransferase family protein n=1 Tax=Pantoea sp. A4 TaxID=1225184 RepID=UPI0003731532|nr:phosphoribosyltransferase family protein [Pantoea sp. A4]